MAPLLILGAGGHGKVVADAALETGNWVEVVFLDDAWPEKKVNGCWPVVGNMQELPCWRDRCKDGVVAIGDNKLRMQFQAKLAAAGFNVVSVIHPAATVSRYATLGAGSVVFAGAVINVDATIGDGAIINTSATVDHDCILGVGVHISPGAHLGGGAKVGDCSWIGIGASVIHLASLGSNTIVGAGAVVLGDIPDGVTAIGMPARPVGM
jgi:sugar O-acyltransferase (sialic acid O-acetyltransferase NeuD family)